MAGQAQRIMVAALLCYLEAGIKWGSAWVYPRTSPLNNFTNNLKGGRVCSGQIFKIILN